MLPARRPFHASMFAAGVLSRFPAWMRLQKSDSVGFRFVDAVLGNELELFNSTLQIYAEYNSITRAPIDSVTTLWQIEIPYFLKSTTLESEDGVSIRVVENEHEFLTNPPTRCEGLYPSGLMPSGLGGKDIVGLEWLDGFPSGVLAIKRNSDDIAPSSLLYYEINSRINEVNLIPSSGDTLGIAYIGLGENSLFESGVLESEWSLRKKYPDGAWITTSGTTVTSMPSGIVWEKQSYIHPETGLKTYYKKLFNNPYGSGVYTQSDIQLGFAPISGTIVIKDPFNLISGLPAVIPSSGLNIYSFTSGHYDEDGSYHQDQWTYKGYEAPIPWDIMPADMKAARIEAGYSGVGVTPTLVGTVSWRQLPSGGYLDDEVYPHGGTFNWVDGSGGFSNVIRFSGGISKYEIQYQYRQYENITQISADPKAAYKYASPSGGNLYFITGQEFYQGIPVETSLSNANAVRFDPLQIRPGTAVYFKLRMNTQQKTTWLGAKVFDKTLQFYNHNIGYTDELGLRNG